MTLHVAAVQIVDIALDVHKCWESLETEMKNVKQQLHRTSIACSQADNLFGGKVVQGKLVENSQRIWSVVENLLQYT